MLTVRKQRLIFLESVRGVAAFVVVMYHTSIAFWQFLLDPRAPQLAHVRLIFRLLAHSPLMVFFNGPFAVVVFFVLSGFVLSYSYFRTPRTEPLTAAALRRYFRLMVPVLVSVLVSYELLSHHLNHNMRAAQLSGSLWLPVWGNFTPHLWSNDANGAIRQGLYGSFFNLETSYNNVLWTMNIELPGSLLVFAFLALFGVVRNRWLLYAVCGCVLAWALDRLYLFDFLMGVVLCDAYVRFEVRQRLFDLGWFAWPLLALALCIGGYLGYPVLPTRITDFCPPRYYPTIGGVMVVGVPLFSMQMQRVMNSRPLAWLGRISFGLYLIHVLILLSLTCSVYVYLLDVRHWGGDSAGIAALGVEVTASLLAGWIMYYIADVPSIVVGKWIAAFLFLRPQQQTEAEVAAERAAATARLANAAP